MAPLHQDSDFDESRLTEADTRETHLLAFCQHNKQNEGC
jgi:hypothetical protein